MSFSVVCDDCGKTVTDSPAGGDACYADVQVHVEAP